MPELTDIQRWIDGPVAAMHVWTAVFALVAGPVLFLRRKAGPLHRILGLAYFASMLAVNISALTIFDMGRFNLFHLFALISLIAVFGAIIALSQAIRTGHQGWYRAHAEFAMWSYFGLVMAGLAQVLFRAFPGVMMGSALGDYFWLLNLVIDVAAFFVIRRSSKVLAARYAAMPSAKRQRALIAGEMRLQPAE